jgi:glycosyltransferase involved in cell wall biosynthesis
MFCVLLDGPVTFDGRVQRTVRTLSRLGPVLLVTSGGSEHDQALFGDRVEVRATTPGEPRGLRRFVLLHRQNDQLATAALEDGRDFDLVWANDYATLHPAREVARATAARLVYDSHELWLATVNQFFPRDERLLRAVAFRVVVGAARALGYWEERRLMRDVDAIVTTNESYRDVLRRRLGRDPIVVHNCPEAPPVTASDWIRGALGLPSSDKVVLYQGIMNPGRGLEALVESARWYPAGVRLVLLGQGVLEQALRGQIAKCGLEDRVFMPGLVSQAELPQWTASADLGVLVLDPINHSKRLSLANKIFEYMGAAVPILATDLPENRRIIERCESGWLLRESSPEGIGAEVARILADPPEMERRGRNGRRCVEARYNWGVESQRLLSAVEPLLPSATPADR